MSTQTRTWQRQVLDAARPHDYADLFWFVEARTPPSQGCVHFAAAYPGRWVPVVPVAPDPAATRPIADMLAHLFRLSNPPSMDWSPALADAESFAQLGCWWYIWSDDISIDAVCDRCGAVEATGHTKCEGATWLCEACAMTNLVCKGTQP